MSVIREIPLSSRNEEDIPILNMSLPLHPDSFNIANCENEDYEPELADLLKAVECPICCSIPNPPIYNCVNGHFSCSSCRPRLPIQRCAYCLAKFTKMRNYPLENLITAQVFICDFRNGGCKARDMNMMEYEQHMKKCWYRSLSQPTNQKTQQHEPNANPTDFFNCPRCNFINSKRKLKCQNCQVSLRASTPMISRPPWVANHQSLCSTDSSL